MAIILIGQHAPSALYVKNKINAANKIGINTTLYHLPNNISEQELLYKITELNNDSTVNGIIIQLPLPEHLEQNTILNAVSPYKDVDGFTAHNIGLLNSWQECLEPSTPQGCLFLIKKYLGPDLKGKKAVVLGRSIIVGRPMCSMLIRESCSVTLLHSFSQDPQAETMTADIVVSAIGKPQIITADFIKYGACVIDVGITHHEGKLCGDVDFVNVQKKAGYITPVPGGIGPMTVCFMLLNTIKAFAWQNNILSWYHEIFAHITKD